MLGGARRLVEVGADDGGDAGAQVGVERAELPRQAGAGPIGAHVIPDTPGIEAQLPQASGHLLGHRAAAQRGIDAGGREDPVLIDGGVAQLAQPHRDAGFSAEVGLLAHVGYAVEPDAGQSASAP